MWACDQLVKFRWVENVQCRMPFVIDVNFCLSRQTPFHLWQIHIQIANNIFDMINCEFHITNVEILKNTFTMCFYTWFITFGIAFHINIIFLTLFLILKVQKTVGNVTCETRNFTFNHLCWRSFDFHCFIVNKMTCLSCGFGALHMRTVRRQVKIPISFAICFVKHHFIHGKFTYRHIWFIKRHSMLSD